MRLISLALFCAHKLLRDNSALKGAVGVSCSRRVRTPDVRTACETYTDIVHQPLGISAHHTNYPQPQAAYNSSKTALLSLAKSLAAEWSSYGIRVNSLSPGYMDTILNDGDGLIRARKSWNERNPMGRMGHPWELTGPLVLLCSNAGRYINGTDIIVDGGAMVF
jgi:NAD(P)-dependent dehydrogenase (short-subunit alcohol dehydrogenase family)